MKKFLAVFALSLLAVMSCKGSSEKSSGGRTSQPDATVKLTGAGATFPYPLYSKWMANYHQLYPNVQINYQSIGSGGGVQQIKAKTVDFGASDAPLNAEEEKAMPASVLQIPTVGGAVVVVYHLPGIEKGLRLNAETLGDIFLGKIQKWNDPKISALNPSLKLPDLAIAVVYRSDGSGTTSIFTDYLAKVHSEFASKVGKGKSVRWPVGLGGKGNEGVTGQVKQTPGAIGYVEYVYAVQNKIPFAALQNKAGNFVEPSPEGTTEAILGALPDLVKDVRTSITNASGANAYPISGLTYILLYQKQENAAKGKALLDFLRWGMKDGQKQAKSLYYAPLPEELIKLNEEKLNTVQLP